MFTFIMLGSGIFWTLSYILIIRQSHLDKTYGMPLAALCANISWEFIFSFIYPPHIIQHIVNIVWFGLDVMILIQALRYGPREFADLNKRFFYTGFGLALVTSFCAVLLITLEFNDAGVHAAFGQNLMMSVLFIAMLYRRRSLRGQSISIAICKCLGTALASLAFFLYYSHPSMLLDFLYIAILFYDVMYIGIVVSMQRHAGAKAIDVPRAISREAESSV